MGGTRRASSIPLSGGDEGGTAAVFLTLRFAGVRGLKFFR